jgi:hypothetical protein
MTREQRDAVLWQAVPMIDVALNETLDGEADDDGWMAQHRVRLCSQFVAHGQCPCDLPCLCLHRRSGQQRMRDDLDPRYGWIRPLHGSQKVPAVYVAPMEVDR